jgi:hypothetical protein
MQHRVLSLVVMLANCALVGIATIDWDNRFYVPMPPGIVFLAGGGAAYLVGYFKPRVIEMVQRQ